MEQGYWFKSDIFTIEKGEDEETNPLCYGKSLAQWLSQKLSSFGYQTEVIPEDWGWCVICEANGYLLWVGCGIITTEELLEKYDENKPPNGSEVVWHAFPNIEVPIYNFKTLWAKWTGKLDLSGPLNKLNSQLETVLKEEPAVEFCEEP